MRIKVYSTFSPFHDRNYCLIQVNDVCSSERVNLLPCTPRSGAYHGGQLK